MESGSGSYDPLKDPKRKAVSSDVGWKYAYYADELRKTIHCGLCPQLIKGGGITRLKQHLVGGYGDTVKCPNTSDEIRREIHKAMAPKKKPSVDEDDGDDVVEVTEESTAAAAAVIGSRPSSGTIHKRRQKAIQIATETPPSKQPKIGGFFQRTPEQVVDDRHSKEPTQRTIISFIKSKEEVERCHRYISDFFIENAIAFNAANSRSYELMMESIAQMGSGFVPPTYHELRVPLLKKAVEKTNDLKKKHQQAWVKGGCTLMSDGWTDRKGRHLINFLVNSPEGTFFMGSVDASGKVQDKELLANLLESKIEEIGPENVVQVVTDNGANFKAAGKLLEIRLPTLFWTPCACHCLDLILEEIGKHKDFARAITQGKNLATFIYRHGNLLDAMRKHTRGYELVRPGVTRFATSFLTLQRLRRFREELRMLFESDEWTMCKLAKSEAGKKAYHIVHSCKFWDAVEDCILASQPILVVLRIADGDETPAMTELGGAMDEVRVALNLNFERKPSLLKKLTGIIDRRWETQMETPLYGAALFLNPGQFFKIKAKATDDSYTSKLREDFNDVLQKMERDHSTRSKILRDVDDYEEERGTFAREMVIAERTNKRPLDWWRSFGGRTPELSKFARRIVGLCCSSSGCERNWSTFEMIHTKKRNRLMHQRLNDLAYVQYNRRIATRFQKCREGKKGFDPLVLEDFDWGTSRWLEEESDGDGSPSIGLIDYAMGATEALEGRRVPRNARGDGTLGDDIPPVPIDDDEILPSDDIDVEDDFGHTPPLHPTPDMRDQERNPFEEYGEDF